MEINRKGWGVLGVHLHAEIMERFFLYVRCRGIMSHHLSLYFTSFNGLRINVLQGNKEASRRETNSVTISVTTAPMMYLIIKSVTDFTMDMKRFHILVLLLPAQISVSRLTLRSAEHRPQPPFLSHCFLKVIFDIFDRLIKCVQLRLYDKNKLQRIFKKDYC